MLSEEELRARRAQMIQRIVQVEERAAQLENAVGQLKTEAAGLRGQVILINEMLGDDGNEPVPAVPEPAEPREPPQRRASKKIPGDTTKKRSKANGK